MIMTPNLIEFSRLCKGASTDTKKEVEYLENSSAEQELPIIELDLDSSLVKNIADYAKSMNNVTIVRKGPIDIITDGIEACCVTMEGSQKRCGGIGDVLAGVMGTFT